ncbi:hypothetical protein FSW04_14435 [Baekduia soli]|uniref:Uncharacterized protein n=1 Tax=Baekduia soli TaxID=496014 RepID=A0A5B8U7J8_9ACTN|nr:hypothetical protein [Baekduia soli]QEC48652.1 hypothetical protein FSW04_14435 [Baekduia soli]
MTLEIVAIGITVLAHLVGAGVLIWTLVDGENIDWRALWPRDDDGGGGGGPEGPTTPDPGDGGVRVGGPLLPDAAPSAVRLRKPGRIGDGYPRPGRRPEHAPTRPGVPARPAGPPPGD